jgi:hypothetical protein
VRSNTARRTGRARVQSIGLPALGNIPSAKDVAVDALAVSFPLPVAPVTGDSVLDAAPAGDPIWPTHQRPAPLGSISPGR